MDDGLRSVLVSGHSFVKRLERFISSRTTTQTGRAVSRDFWLSRACVEFYGLPGCNIPRYRARILPYIQAFPSDIIYIELGVVDLCNPNLSPELIARNLASLAFSLQNIPAVQSVILGAPIWRLHNPPNMSDFPQRLHKFTEALKELVQSYHKVTVWDHRRLWRHNPNYFAPDGLHLSDLGNLQYYKSVRGAVDRRLKHI
ncbi:hypothetical protein Bbelb_065320 [Branchiostoma belcheri]|nr:hypothetical protein Bbelb_065320 [Branchiostoma belcheri]